MNICDDCTKTWTCKNKPLSTTKCRDYEGDKYWCVSTIRWLDFYAKAETASKAKYAMFKVIRQQEYYDDFRFSEFVHECLHVMQIDRDTYNCHKEDGWCV